MTVQSAAKDEMFTLFGYPPTRLFTRRMASLVAGMLLLVVVGCGGNGAPDMQVCTDAQNDQPRSSCVIEGYTRVTSMEEFEPVCSSRCDTLEHFTATSPDVVHLKPLVHIHHIQGVFEVDWIHPNATLEGVENIETIGKVYSEQTNMIVASTGFESLAGFESLREVHSTPTTFGPRTAFLIANNVELKELDGFPELTAIGGTLSVQSNPELRSITGFPKLDTIKGDLVILNNERLPRCEAEAFAERIPNIEGEIHIRGGASGDCN